MQRIFRNVPSTAALGTGGEAVERLLPANAYLAWKGVSKLGQAISGSLWTKKVWDFGGGEGNVG